MLPATALAYAVPTPHVVVDLSWDWWFVGEWSEQERLDIEEDLLWALDQLRTDPDFHAFTNFPIHFQDPALQARVTVLEGAGDEEIQDAMDAYESSIYDGVYFLPLPYVRSRINMNEVAWSGETGELEAAEDLGLHYSPCPRTQQIRDVVDAALSHLKEQTSRLKLTLRDMNGRDMGQPFVYDEAFLRGTAIGWFGAGKVLKAAGLFEDTADLDQIRSVRVEVG
jgi:hypothetical protein